MLLPEKGLEDRKTQEELELRQKKGWEGRLRTRDRKEYSF